MQRSFGVSSCAIVVLCCLAAAQPACRPSDPTVRVVVFDVGGVLSKDMIDTKLADLAGAYDLDREAVLQAGGSIRERADRGEIADREFWIQTLALFGVQATDADTEIDSYLELVDGTLDIARSLSTRYRVAILSNDSHDMAAARRRKFGFDSLFEPIVISAAVGVTKPDEAIYRILLDELDVAPEECVFIDNNPANVEAARAAGLLAIQFEDAAQLRTSLAELGVLVDD